MFAVLWKNGQLNRVDELIKGILDKPAPKESAAIACQQVGDNSNDVNQPVNKKLPAGS